MQDLGRNMLSTTILQSACRFLRVPMLYFLGCILCLMRSSRWLALCIATCPEATVSTYSMSA